MKIATLIGGVLLWASVAGAVDVTVTIPNEKLGAVQEAATAYNARTGQSLTTKQWGFLVLRSAVVTELKLRDEAQMQAEIATQEATFKGAVQTKEQELSQKHATTDAGWD